MKRCEYCGTTKAKIVGKGGKHKVNLCHKHYQQMNIHGSIPEKTRYDANDIITEAGVSKIVLRDIKGNKINETIIDTDMISKVMKHKWCKGTNYVISDYDGKMIHLHRIIMDCPDGLIVDHINHNKLDNRRSNLRICTNQENLWNCKGYSNNTSGHTGVRWNKNDNKWSADITVSYKRIHLGLFVNIEDAIRVRRKAEVEYFGKFSFKHNEVV